MSAHRSRAARLRQPKVSKSATADFDGRVSKDGQKRDLPAAILRDRPREECGLLKNEVRAFECNRPMRLVSGNRSTTARKMFDPPTCLVSYSEPKCLNRRDKQGAANRPRHNLPCTARRAPPSLLGRLRPAPAEGGRGAPARRSPNSSFHRARAVLRTPCRSRPKAVSWF